MRNDLIILTELARELNEPPKRISEGFYQGLFDDRHGVFLGGRRFIYKNKIGEIRDTLARTKRRPKVKV
jgi:hypothetical protein